MKIGILTYYGVHNHGAVLQANALRTILAAKGHDAEFLTFNRNYDFISQEQSKKYKISLASIGFYFKYMAEKGVGNILYNIKKNKVLNQYRAAMIPFAGRYSDYDGDMVIIGSDEVFSLEIGINPSLFGHALKCKNAISYAGSFGSTTMQQVKELGCLELIASGLQRMSAVSVRDGNSKEIAEALAQKEATLVCDPVILYGYEKEMTEFVPTEKDYIVIYSYDKNMNQPEQIEAIRNFAKKNGCKVYSVGYHHKWCDKNIAPTPNELLGWIKNAKYVVTDTFHGSVISIICNTPMLVKLSGNQNKLKFLLTEYGLTGRIMEDYTQLDEVAANSVDFDHVNAVISERRQASMNFLEAALKTN